MLPSELVPNRSLCGVIEELRTCVKTMDFRLLAALLEEAQSYANRMEDGLSASRSASRKAWDALTAEEPDPDVAIEALEKRWRFKKGDRDYF